MEELDSKSDYLGRAYMALNVMNILDAFGTLVALHFGATEISPTAGVLLMAGAFPFVLAKFVVVWLSSTFLRILGLERVLIGFACLYGLVVAWELVHLARGLVGAVL